MTRITTTFEPCGVYSAHREGFDAETEPCGHGATEAEAVADLEWLEGERLSDATICDAIQTAIARDGDDLSTINATLLSVALDLPTDLARVQDVYRNMVAGMWGLMPERFVSTPAELDAWCTFMRGRDFPMRVTCTSATRRSIAQNKLQRLWCNEVSEQLGDMTPEEVRGHAKAYFGVPILLAEDEEFAEAYTKHVKPLPYETKLACMMEPIDFPVTRRMTTKQLTAYLDAFCAYWRGKGVMLTEPEIAQ